MDQQVEPISKPELLARIRSERKYLEETLAQLDEDQMVKPGAEAAWSVKDMLAHLVAWEGYLWLAGEEAG